MMTAEQLKNSIFSLAFSGKLTERLESDGTAAELLKEIGKDKFARKNKTIIVKKDNGDYYEFDGTKETCITDELLFDIPDNWAWVHLNEVAESGLGKTLNKSKDTGDVKQYLCSINVYWDGIHLDEVKEAKFSESDTEKYRLMKGDLLICEGGDAGRAAIWENDNEMYYQNALHRVRFRKGVEPYYFRTLLEFYKLNGTIESYCKGMTIKHLVQSSLNSIRFPLPPLAEQKRIVAKIEELMPFVDQYAAASTKLNTLNASFPEMMKKSILQEAVQGKLVPQDPNDEPASVLLKKIADEKKRLIKEGKIKKQKPLPEITEAEIPFEIPESWEWVRLIDCVIDISDIDHRMPEAQPSGIPYVSPLNFTPAGIDFDSAKCVSEEDYLKLSKKCKPEKEDIIFPRYGTIGVLRFINVERKFLVSYSSCVIKTSKKNTYPLYVFYALQSPHIKQEINKYINKTTQPNVGMQSIKNFLFPIPPLEEQKRIVERLELALDNTERI